MLKTLGSFEILSNPGCPRCDSRIHHLPTSICRPSPAPCRCQIFAAWWSHALGAQLRHFCASVWPYLTSQVDGVATGAVCTFKSLGCENSGAKRGLWLGCNANYSASPARRLYWGMMVVSSWLTDDWVVPLYSHQTSSTIINHCQPCSKHHKR